MSFNWSDYLDLARFLSKDGPASFQEAASRSATSRAYYAAYGHAKCYAADQLGFHPTGFSSDHGTLRDFFQAQGRGKIAMRLNRLRRWRNQCDYDNDVPNLSAILAQSLDHAEAVLKDLSS
jgi:hypothetical protein